MRVYSILAATILLFASPASAQTLDQLQDLTRQLNLLTNKTASMASDREPAGPAPAKPVFGVFVAPPQAAADGISHPAAVAGWNTFNMSACIALVVGGEQYNVAYMTTGAAFATQSAYAAPIVAANCASGRTFLLYFESDRTTISAAASLAR